MGKNIICDTWIDDGDLKKLEQHDFTIGKINILPNSLFKYFSNTYNNDRTNYSQQAIITNDIFLANPEMFNDPFDCSVVINFSEYYITMIQFYSKLFGIDKEVFGRIFEFYRAFHYYQFSWLFSKLQFILINNKNLINNIDFRYCSNEIEKMELEFFLLKLQNYIYENCNNHNLETLIFNGIFELMRGKVKDETNKLKKNFRIASLTVQNDNILMWSHYANNHKGFCIEYAIDKTEINELLFNLSPVIYSNERPKMSKFFFNSKTIFEWYKNGLLRKADLWSYEKEWRLVLLKNDCSLEGTFHFYPIKAVYLGCKMPDKERKKIEKLIMGKNIELYQGEISEEYYQINFKKIYP